MKLKHKLLLVASVVGLPAVVFAATVQFQNFSDSGAVIQVSGQMPGTIARLERSTDLTTWAPVAAQTVAPDGTAFLVHALTPGDPRGFYRVAAEPAPRLHSPVQIVCNEDQVERNLGTAPAFPDNSTAPQSTHGSAYPQLDTSITPLKAGNKLMVEVEVTSSTSVGNGGWLAAGLFLDGVPEALAVAVETQQSTNLGSGAGASSHLVRLRHFVTAPSTAPLTFKVRLSNSTSSDPVRVNRTFYSGNFGNKVVSSMTVTEIQQ